MLIEQVRVDHSRPVLEVGFVGGTRSGVILAAWGNGLILVSGNPLQGGPPYRCITMPARTVDQACVRILERMQRYEGTLSDTGPGASFTELCVRRKRSRACISSMNLSFAGDEVAKSPVARKEFQALWLDVCLEANGLDSGEAGIAPTSVEGLLGH